MFNRIIALIDAEVNTSPIVAASAVADDAPYEGIRCNDGQAPRWSWCQGCQAEAERRDATALQLALPPTPAEAVCDFEPAGEPGDYGGFPPVRPDFNPRQLAAMAIRDAIEDEKAEAWG